jgi:hypothetical protein
VVQPVNDAAVAAVQAERLARGSGVYQTLLPGVARAVEAADAGVRVDGQVL